MNNHKSEAGICVKKGRYQMVRTESKQHSSIPPLLKFFILFGGVVVILYTFLSIISIGPGLPPDHNFAAVMISNQSMVFPPCPGNSRAEGIDSAFCFEQQTTGSSPLFPLLTQKSAYILFRNVSSGANYTVAIWCFNNRADFLTAQDRLQGYIRKHGTALPVTLDLRREQEQVRLFNRENPRMELKLVPESLQATAFIGNTTAGYFFVSNEQFAAGRDDHLIEYFGMLNNNSLQDGSEDLQQLVAFNSDTWNLFHGSAALS
jgi:hypothetical protein